MNLDFLEVLSEPTRKVEGHCGTQGTARVHAAPSVPSTYSLSGTLRDNLSAVDASAGICPAVSLSRPAPPEASKESYYAAVPLVPQCPPQNEGVLIFRWLRNRCKRSRHVWGSEKSLWSDYCTWCEQQKEPACCRELFCETMNDSFTREEDGWKGVILAIDLWEPKYVM